MYYYSRPYLNEIPPHFIHEIKTKRYDNDVIGVNVFFHKIDTFSCLASGFLWDTTNRQRLFAVRRFQFQVAKVSNFSKAFFVSCLQVVVFFPFEVLDLYRPINMKKSNIYLASRRQVEKTISCL